MGAETFGSDVSGPATAAAPLRPQKGATQQAAAALPGDNTSSEHGGETDGALRLKADREGLEGLVRDFGGLDLAPPTLVAADVGDAQSWVRRPR